jgi:hypothetical protein
VGYVGALGARRSVFRALLLLLLKATGGLDLVLVSRLGAFVLDWMGSILTPLPSPKFQSCKPWHDAAKRNTTLDEQCSSNMSTERIEAAAHARRQKGAGRGRMTAGQWLGRSQMVGTAETHGAAPTTDK